MSFDYIWNKLGI